MNLSRNKEISGMYVINKRPAILNTKNFDIPGSISFISNLVIVCAMNIFIPNGGVYIPIARFVTIMIPRWTGSIPIAVAAGT